MNDLLAQCSEAHREACDYNGQFSHKKDLLPSEDDDDDDDGDDDDEAITRQV